jgi:hypothetical protein
VVTGLKINVGGNGFVAILSHPQAQMYPGLKKHRRTLWNKTCTLPNNRKIKFALGVWAGDKCQILMTKVFLKIVLCAAGRANVHLCGERCKKYAPFLKL